MTIILRIYMYIYFGIKYARIQIKQDLVFPSVNPLSYFFFFRLIFHVYVSIVRIQMFKESNLRL